MITYCYSIRLQCMGKNNIQIGTPRPDVHSVQIMPIHRLQCWICARCKVYREKEKHPNENPRPGVHRVQILPVHSVHYQTSVHTYYRCTVYGEKGRYPSSNLILGVWVKKKNTQMKTQGLVYTEYKYCPYTAYTHKHLLTIIIGVWCTEKKGDTQVQT